MSDGLSFLDNFCNLVRVDCTLSIFILLKCLWKYIYNICTEWNVNYLSEASEDV